MCRRSLAGVKLVNTIGKVDRQYLKDICESNENSSLFHSLANMSPDGVVIHVNGEIVFANQATADLLNFETGQDLVGHTIFEYISATDQAMFEYRLQGILVDRLRLPFYEYTVICNGGGTLQVEMCGQPIRWKGQIAGQTIIRDLTEKYENEDVFRTLNRAMEQCPDSVIITDHLGIIDYVNPYFTERYGYSFDEMREGKTLHLLRGLMPRIAFREMMMILSEGRVWKGEFGIYAKSGEQYWEQASVSPVLDKDQKICHYICIMQDITVRKQTEENLQSALRKAEDFNEAKSAFLANMSHEFRTPLNAIIGFNSLLISGPNNSIQDKVVEYSKYSLEAGEHMLSLVTDLLDLSKIEAHQLEIQEQAFQVTGLVDDVKRLVAKKAKENRCELVTDISSEFVLYADSRRVKQILLNLVFNAIKFSKGGTVSIEAKNPTDGKIYIRDTGIGMSPAEVELALSPFEQTEGESFSKKYDGAGLGLPIASNLMILHDGTLSIESETGAGTLITLTFPKNRVSTC